MPSNPFATYATPDILTALGDGSSAPIGMAEMIAELKDRVIKTGDDDDSPQHRGGIRPGHAPILP